MDDLDREFPSIDAEVERERSLSQMHNEIYDRAPQSDAQPGPTPRRHSYSGSGNDRRYANAYGADAEGDNLSASSHSLVVSPSNVGSVGGSSYRVRSASQTKNNYRSGLIMMGSAS